MRLLYKLKIISFLISVSSIGLPAYGQILTHTKEIGLYQTSKHTTFIRDNEMLSPKSADFIGDTLVINALEGGNTLFYNTVTWDKLPTLSHKFNKSQVNQLLTPIENFPYPTKSQEFTGKPVEMTHNGTKMWVPYYRLSWDQYSQHHSAIAQIDIKTHKVEKLIPSGSIPKMVRISADNKTLVATHWGDNTVGIYTLKNNDIIDYHYVIIDNKFNISNITADRDIHCGFCLRGTVFTPDNQYILVARMGGGGIAVINNITHKYIGTIRNVPLTPRHLALSPDGATLYISTCFSGEVARIDMGKIKNNIEILEEKTQSTKISKTEKNVVNIKDWQTVKLGSSVRTIALSYDYKYTYAALNDKSELAVINNSTMTVVERHKMASFPVGLAVSPNDHYIIVTSQGKNGKGGNHIDILERK